MILPPMAIPTIIEKGFFQLADTIMSVIPRRQPSTSALAGCRIISHRGERDNKNVFENTFAAFDPLVGSGVWAIEIDIRWTRDLYPVVFHDADCQRLFNDSSQIAQLNLVELQHKFPLIPSLSEVVQRYKGKLHLMIELKQQAYIDRQTQNQRLQQILSPLTPRRDFHFISLAPETMFPVIDFLPSRTFLPIVYTNTAASLRLLTEKNYGALLGHYCFVQNRHIKQCQQHDWPVGLGFINSKNSLLREINRGVKWLYTDHALKIQALINQLAGERK